MARRYFGTDGVRGVVGQDLTPDLVGRLGKAFARWSGPSQVLLGRDTRASGPELEAALAAGLTAGGATATLGGVLPTPAVALLSDEHAGVTSASHNPPEYNGVKFFRDGRKLTDADEEEIETLLEDVSLPSGAGTTSAAPPGLAQRYVEIVCERFGGPLEGLHVLVDCANGAMFEVAPAAFAQLGATVVSVGNEPDGKNINVGCGATDLRLLSRMVAAGEFELGVAFDGDGDRMLAVDAEGREVDGDQILAVLALHLGVELVAVTSMTNLGFHRLMEDRGVKVLTTDVGDRYVFEALREHDGVLGGEQSGHLMYLDGHTTGDGLVAAILLSRAVREEGVPLADLAAVMPKFPQVKENVPVRSTGLSADVLAAVERLNEELAGRGRVLVRPSGTEPVIRVLAEAENAAFAAEICGKVSSLVRESSATAGL
ncbi:MAG: phosphoglucosamine mutase [Gaiellaceae bacterium]